MRISDWSSDVCSSDLPWTPLAASLLSLQASRERPPDTDPEAAGVTLFSRAAADCERALFDADAPAAGEAKGADTVAFDLLAARQLLQGDAQGARRLLDAAPAGGRTPRSEEHTSELQSLMRISYAVFCLKKKKTKTHTLIIVRQKSTKDATRLTQHT